MDESRKTIAGTGAAVVAVFAAVVFTIGFVGQREDRVSDVNFAAPAPTAPPLAPTTVPTTAPTTGDASTAAPTATVPLPNPTVATTEPVESSGLDEIAVEFAAYMAENGFSYSGRYPGGYLAGCGAVDPEADAFWYQKDDSQVLLVMHASAGAARTSHNLLTSITVPCATAPDIESATPIENAADWTTVLYGFANGEPVQHSDYLLRDRAILVGAAPDASEAASIATVLLGFNRQLDASVDAASSPGSWPSPEPTSAAGTFDPQRQEAGPVTVAVAGGVQFELDEPLLAIHLPGHSAVYIDSSYTGEANIFTPLTDRDGDFLATFDEVKDVLAGDPLNLVEQVRTSVGGFPTLVFEGNPPELEIIFYTDIQTVGLPDAGWRSPGNLRLWLIDGPSGPVIVTAEALNSNVAAFAESINLAREIVASISLR